MRKPPSPPPPAGAVSGRGCSRRARARGAHRETAAASRQNSGDTEREFHHYGSGLRLLPNDTLALRAGFAASLGAFAAVDVETGAPSMAFHADPARLAWYDYSGDHGQNAFGALRESGCFVDNATEPGLLVGFGCDVWFCGFLDLRCFFGDVDGGGGGGGALSGLPGRLGRLSLHGLVI